MKVYRFSNKLITPKGCYVRTHLSENGVEFFQRVPIDRNDSKIVSAVKNLRHSIVYVVSYGGDGENLTVAESYSAANIHHQLSSSN